MFCILPTIVWSAGDRGGYFSKAHETWFGRKNLTSLGLADQPKIVVRVRMGSDIRLARPSETCRVRPISDLSASEEFADEPVALQLVNDLSQSCFMAEYPNRIWFDKR